MRLPIARPWRAFRELDAYTDQQCKRFLADAHRNQGRLVGMSNLAVALVLIGGVVGWMAVMQWLFGTVIVDASVATRVIVAFSLLAFLPLCVAVISRRTMRELLKRELERWRDGGQRECAECGYPLVELPEKDHKKTCPECGCVVEIAVAPVET